MGCQEEVVTDVRTAGHLNYVMDFYTHKVASSAAYLPVAASINPPPQPG